MPAIVDLVAGARPNFMKLAPVCRALRDRPEIRPRIVHTGQHYDPFMNDVFFDQLVIPRPDVHLEVGSGSHGFQTARILERYEEHLLSERPAAVVVFGDVNSTVACALAAAKLQVPVAHVEAGLRSFDGTMPEEINRRLTDAIADLLLVTEPSAVANLAREGIDPARVKEVGNVMIDTVAAHIERARSLPLPEALAGVRDYGVVTMHRPSNVDAPDTLMRLMDLLEDLSQQLQLAFPVHPRTHAALQRLNRATSPASSRLHLLEPLPYEQSLGLLAGARVVLTDSGGIQEETTWLDVPCLTLRENTERPVTVDRGTSRLVGNDPDLIRAAFGEAIAGKWPASRGVPLWDGSAAVRVADEIVSWLSGAGSGKR